MSWVRWLAALTALCLGLGAQAAPQKVLHYAFNIAETGFDPAQVIDQYSRTITAHIFESLYTYDPLARPSKIKSLTAAGMPEVSADFRTWTVKIRPGIYFADDPAFKGRRRELTANDYVYAYKRFADPVNKSAAWSTLEENDILGLSALREEALKGGRFDYDRPIEGLRALDRYTVRFKLGQTRPRFLMTLAARDLFGAVAREAVEAYGDRIMEHPVGTGPFRLVQWRRSSLIVLERNPGYREEFYDAEPAADDAPGQALLRRFKGRRLPMIDRIEVSIIDEAQPRWLSFLNAQSDFIERVPAELIGTAMPNGQLAPNLAKKGIQAYRIVHADAILTYFNMEDPVVGGYAPDKVALRRAIALGYNVGQEIRLIRRGQAVPAQSPLLPDTSGYDPAFKSENGDYDPARAKALLDLYGYVDRDGDGWRERPDGSPLVLRMSWEPDQQSRLFSEQWQRDMKAIGLRVDVDIAKWPEHFKQARAGKLMMWTYGVNGDVQDGQSVLELLYGPQAGNQNLARFKRPEFDAIYDAMLILPDGPERERLYRELKRLAVAWMPYKVSVHRVLTDMAHPWLAGYRRPLFWLDWWQYVDIDPRAVP